MITTTNLSDEAGQAPHDRQVGTGVASPQTAHRMLLVTPPFHEHS